MREITIKISPSSLFIEERKEGERVWAAEFSDDVNSYLSECNHIRSVRDCALTNEDVAELRQEAVQYINEMLDKIYELANAFHCL